MFVYFKMFLQIAGIDGQGYAFQRITPTAISAIKPEVPVVRMTRITRGYYEKTAILTCSVISIVPFDVRWSKGGDSLGNTLFYRYAFTINAMCQLR